MRHIDPEAKLSRRMLIIGPDRNRLGIIEKLIELEHLKQADPAATIIMGRCPVAFLKDGDAWLTLNRTFKLSDYLADDYCYREGITWRMAAPTRRLPRGLCLKRESEDPGLQTTDIS